MVLTHRGRTLESSLFGVFVFLIVAPPTVAILKIYSVVLDRLAGLDNVPASDEDQVRSILIDLMRRETSNYAAEFRNHVLGNLRTKVPLSKDPQRSAAFKVLKQAETPAVLIELGYMSNPEDLARLSKADWQQQVAAAIATSVESYFAQRTARAR